MVQALSALPGVTVFPSAANFLLVRVPDPDAATDKLRAERVLIKNLSKMHKLLSGCIRVTVSTPEENSVFLNALKASLT
jgi:histidinol-phosphate aminotransferase